MPSTFGKHFMHCALDQPALKHGIIPAKLALPAGVIAFMHSIRGKTGVTRWELRHDL